MKFISLILAALPVFGQLHSSNAEFGKALKIVVNDVQSDKTPSSDLPESSSCDKLRAVYKCEWKTRANSGSVSALESALLERVAAAIPSTWARRAHVSGGLRFTEFTGQDLLIRITSKATPDGSPPWDYTVRLVIERVHPH